MRTENRFKQINNVILTVSKKDKVYEVDEIEILGLIEEDEEINLVSKINKALGNKEDSTNYRITDIVVDDSVIILESEYNISLEDTIYLINNIDEVELDKYLAYQEYLGDRYFKELITDKDLFNKLEDVFYINDVSDYKDLGEYWVDNGLIEVPKHLEFYIDYELLGRDLVLGGNGTITPYGFIEE